MRIWISQRRPERELLGETPPIRRRQPILILGPGRLEIDFRRSSLASVTRLARGDGFASSDQFYEFFLRVHGAPFTGYLYRW